MPGPATRHPATVRHRILRISAHLHNDAAEYRYLAGALEALLAEEER